MASLDEDSASYQQQEAVQQQQQQNQNNNTNQVSSSSSESEDDEDEVEDFHQTDRYKVWRKHVRDIYRFCLHFEPAWPCYSVQFLPYMTNTSFLATTAGQHHQGSSSSQKDPLHKTQTLLAGSTTGGQEQAYLKLLTLDLPGGLGTQAPPGLGEVDQEAGEIGGYGFAPRYVDFTVSARFFHDGDVLKCRHMPSNPNVFLTASSTGNCYLFDYTTMSILGPPNRPERPKLPPVPVQLPGQNSRFEKEQGIYRTKNREQELWDQKTRGDGQHKVVLKPGADILAKQPFVAGGKFSATSTEFNLLDQSGIVCTGFNNGAIAQWNLSAPVPTPATENNNNNNINPSPALNNNNNTKSIKISNKPQKVELEPTWVRWCPQEVTEVAFSYSDANIMASASSDGIVRLWDLREDASAKCQQEISLSSKSNSGIGATCAAWSIFESNKIAAGYTDGVARVWDTRASGRGEPLCSASTHSKQQNIDGAAVASSSSNNHNSSKDVTSIQWNPHDKNVLATGGEDKNIVWLDVAKQKVLFVHAGHNSAIRDMSWSWQDAFSGLMVSADDTSIIAWCPRAHLLDS